MRSKSKVMATITFSDDEVSDHEFGSDKDGNSITFIFTVVVDESILVENNLSDGELSKSTDL